MTKVEIAKLVRVLSANYRNWPAEGMAEDTIHMWERAFRDVSFIVGQAAVDIHLNKSVFPPTIADIRAAVAILENGIQIEWSEAFSLITNAIRKFGWQRGTEAIASLPPDVAAMTKRFGWQELCENDNPDALRAHFKSAWETQSKRKQERNILPDEIIGMIETAGLIKRLE